MIPIAYLLSNEDEWSDLHIVPDYFGILDMSHNSDHLLMSIFRFCKTSSWIILDGRHISEVCGL